MFDYAAHSDLLVYWTGSDIDRRYDPGWHAKDSSKTVSGSELESRYLKRLTSILTHGFWMTIPSHLECFPDSEVALHLREGRSVLLPRDVPRVSFTELRLSQARTHAKRYGRLGIGVKRPFLFDRGGRPVVYLGPKDNRERDVFLCACDRLGSV